MCKCNSSSEAEKTISTSGLFEQGIIISEYSVKVIFQNGQTI